MPRRFVLVCAATAVTLAAGPAAGAQAAPPSFDPARCASIEGGRQSDPWQVRRLQLTEAHRFATGDGVRVALIDTGIDSRGTTVLPVQRVTDYTVTGYDRAQQNKGGGGDVDCVLGTQAAALMAGSRSGDFVGVAPDARVLGLRARQLSDDDPEKPEPVSAMAEAVTEAVDLDCDVIVIPRSSAATPAYRAAVQSALDAGVVVVTGTGGEQATGDQPAGDHPYPASHPGVIAVGMTGPDDRPEIASPVADGVSLGAPAYEVVTVGPSGAKTVWGKASGTALAAAQVGGVAALLLESEPGLTPAEVRARLMATADAPPVATPDSRVGAGIVNPVRALTERPDGTRTPVPASEPPVTDPRERGQLPPTLKLVTIGVAVGTVVIAAVAAVVAAVIPSGRRRGWRSAR